MLNRDFELYELRKFFATWMVSQGVPESIAKQYIRERPYLRSRLMKEGGGTEGAG